MKHARGDAAFRLTVTLSGVAVLGVLALMIISTTLDALPVLRSQGLGTFLTGTTWDPGGSRTAITGTYQAGVFLYGTLVTALIALLLAVPVSLGIGLFLSDIAHPRVRGPFVALIDLLAAIPSVVYGLWGLHFFAPVVLKPTAQTLSGGLGWIPLFEGPVIAFNVFYAGVVLAIMVLPIITSIAREVFSSVPDAQRHAAYAVGATRWEVMRSVVLPRSRPGIVGAIMLGLGRALGETIAVALLIGGATAINASIFQPGETVASKIVNTFQESAPEAVRALIALGVTLFAITIVINIAARLIVRRMGDLSGEAVA
ncbi:MAG TPA: phosphate ABC transporter permease subunit PstC [Candidatus Limnocylindria bacterium]|nr:phosphate ABC transporter permease subunit PstC [Candidatus Limnocylindria bacterium]